MLKQCFLCANCINSKYVGETPPLKTWTDVEPKGGMDVDADKKSAIINKVTNYYFVVQVGTLQNEKELLIITPGM